MSLTVLVDTIIQEAIDNLPENTPETRLDYAFALYELRQNIQWKATKYGGWMYFCKKEIPLTRIVIDRYMTVAKNIENWGYPKKGWVQVYLQLGWSRFSQAMLMQKKPMSPTEFKQKYQTLIGVMGKYRFANSNITTTVKVNSNHLIAVCKKAEELGFHYGSLSQQLNNVFKHWLETSAPEVFSNTQ